METKTTNEFKFTKGNWTYNKSSCRIETDWKEPFQDEDCQTSIINLIGAMGGEDVEADAKLMAASKDLLEALIEIVEPLAGQEVFSSKFIKAFAAINKATK